MSFRTPRVCCRLSAWRPAPEEARRTELTGKAAVAEAAARPGARAGGKAAVQGECDKPPPTPTAFLPSARGARATPGPRQATDPAQRPAPGAGPSAELRGGTMQVTPKTLQQQTFKIEIDPEETVRARGPGRAGVAARGPRGTRGARGPGRGAARPPL